MRRLFLVPSLSGRHFLLPLSASLKCGLGVGRACSMKGAGQLANVVAVKASDISDHDVRTYRIDKTRH